MLGSIVKRIDKLGSEFLWHGNEEKRAFSLVKFTIVIKNMKHGGLGIQESPVQMAWEVQLWGECFMEES